MNVASHCVAPALSRKPDGSGVSRSAPPTHGGPVGVMATLVTLAVVLGGFPRDAAAAGRVDDSLWLISTRHLTSDVRCAPLEAPPLRAQRLAQGIHDPCCSPQAFDAQPFDALAALLDEVRRDPATPTIFYIHGNRMEAHDALSRGQFVYREVARCRSSAQPVRWVIWSWPSERSGVLVRDARVKAERTDAQALYLAGVLRQVIEAGSAVHLIGYSFGARIATGSLHALAGGTIEGRRLPGESVRGAGVRLGLLVPAVDRRWLLPGNPHGLATQNMDRMTVFYNPADRALRRYWLLEPGQFPTALGLSGPLRLGPRFDGTPVPVLARDCSRLVGPQHDEPSYYTTACRAGALLARQLEGA